MRGWNEEPAANNFAERFSGALFLKIRITWPRERARRLLNQSGPPLQANAKGLPVAEPAPRGADQGIALRLCAVGSGRADREHIGREKGNQNKRNKTRKPRNH